MGRKKEIANAAPNSKKKKAEAPPATPSAQQPFTWPRSLCAKFGKPSVFEIQELGAGLYVIDDVLTPEECRCITDQARPLVKSTNPSNLPPKKGEAFRNNERFQVSRMVAHQRACVP